MEVVTAAAPVGTIILGCMVLLTLTFALFGFLSPANRGSLITALLMLYVFAGGAGGHAAARLYKSFRGTDWMLNTLLTATLVPGFTFACFLVIDISLLSVGSSGAVPVSTLLTLVVLWFGVSVPLVFLGAYVGFKKDVAPNPVDPGVPFLTLLARRLFRLLPATVLAVLGVHALRVPLLWSRIARGAPAPIDHLAVANHQVVHAVLLSEHGSVFERRSQAKN